MTLELSTINALLVLVITLQVWLIKQVFNLQTKLAIVISHCPRCRHAEEQAENDPR